MRFSFGPFVLSPGRRVLLEDGRPVPLIPRYFDLLVLLVEERHRAVTRQEIFDLVWADVVVSDGALSQAIRTIRRALRDEPQSPRFVRTVSRHGYQFVGGDVREEADGGPLSERANGTASAAKSKGLAADAARERLIGVLVRASDSSAATEEERYDAAVALHELGTDEALQRLGSRPGHEKARAILRDARWDAPGAGSVPLLAARGRAAAVADVVILRLRHAARLAWARWLSSILWSTASGVVAGVAGGIALGLVPGARLNAGTIAALMVIGGAAGAVGAAGIGGGLAAAETLARSARASALTAGGALGGFAAGSLAHHAFRALLSGVFGHDVPEIAGGAEGVVLGAVLGFAYALATRGLVAGGMAAPRGKARWRVALLTGIGAAVAGIGLAAEGHRLVGTSLDAVAGLFAGSQVGLAPLAQLLGEDSLRPVTQMIVSGFEALMLGIGTAYGLMRRPRTG